MVDAQYFDAWFADLERHPARDRIVGRALGLPPGLQTDGVLTWSAMPRVAAALGLAPGDTLVDLACGRGAWGVELAAAAGARLVGVDFSAVALDVARRRAASRGVEATFVLGSLDATGLADGSASAAVCVDSMQFAPPDAGLAELRRVVAPGGPVVLTGWAARDLDDELVPERLRRDVCGGLVAAGFSAVVEHEEPAWRAVERVVWDTAVAAPADPADPALSSMQAEAQGALQLFDRLRRLWWVARA
ncbi:class I SAM-dependent methyltransferase [Cellulomonas alba]|uniref:Class I SAM-dependent methyltransferase n=1 Tax=Cellulomonas alba TaxID=3053467 RepID=A0ABT7SCE9_9CELL|nr:class I SAM-dependent methyltransferase [Cellulomonas alba]MDM7853860.1 class I SAM-dependent methyltransferase [Cellulomonas alba]